MPANGRQPYGEQEAGGPLAGKGLPSLGFPQSFIKELDFVNGAQTSLHVVPPGGDGSFLQLVPSVRAEGWA